MWGSEIEKGEFAKLYPLFYGSQQERDYRKLFKESASLVKKGYAPAMCTVGGMYSNSGFNVRRDYRESFRLFMESALKGYPASEVSVGNFYVMAFPKHDACEYDEAEAASWYIKAAEHGNSVAQYSLAFSYQQGRGVPRDPIAAYVWACLSVHCAPIRFRPAEVVRDQTVQQLDEKQLEGAQRRIKQMQEVLPYEWSDHMVYWRGLARKFGIID